MPTPTKRAVLDHRRIICHLLNADITEFKATLIPGKRYYFDNIDRRVHCIYKVVQYDLYIKHYLVLKGDKKLVKNFDTNRLLLRGITLRNGKIVAFLNSFKTQYYYKDSDGRFLPAPRALVKVK